ncbi:unnamed protein product [Schistosoma mattheei]|uniref:Neurotransmitter-gated ion-channel transmembrane domain-containing protein n=1 Tax=Schistosoma mattheei TaxID=31246 RepID=A0A183PEL8_9TREM|nr:unnamed protein product [Schistosoma mattheei]
MDFHLISIFQLFFITKSNTPPTLGASIKRNIQTYGGEDQTYIDVTIYVYMQRRALYYMFNIIIPCMIMSMMALLVFTLPPEANEKIVLGVTTLLSLTMLLQLVADKLPQTSSGNSIETLINIWLASILRIDHDLSDSYNNNNDNYHGDNNNKTEPNFKNSKEKLIPSENSFQLDQYDYDKINHHIHLNHSYNNNNNNNGDGNNNARNATVWSNIIDMNSEFRPAIVIHKPFKHDDNHNSDMKKSLFMNQIKLKSELQSRIQQNYFIDLDPDYDRDRGDQHQLSTDLSGKPLNNMPYHTTNTTNTTTIPEDSGNSRTNATSRLQYTCKRNLTEKSKYFNKTIPRFHLSSSSSSNESPQDSSLSSSPTPLPPASSSSITDPSSSSPFKQNNNNDSMKFDIILLKLKQISNELRFITSDMHNKDKEIKTSNQWRLACRVLDRLCLLIFTALNLFTTLGILTSAPTVIKAFTSRGAPSQPM